ncbi:MAG: 2-oxoacid:ferredoxin oxidoreductase subunit beta, partial [Acidimicrobiia bacterium]|nr:2-oxoacid:ferredoxin oxidoreductase subunit beta [Acidimicrobiia bacterium]
SYDSLLEQQLAEAQAAKGPGELRDLIRSVGTWTVD